MQHSNLNVLQMEAHLLQVKDELLQINVSTPSTILPQSLKEDQLLQTMVNLQREEVVLLHIEGPMLQVEDCRQRRKLELLPILRDRRLKTG